MDSLLLNKLSYLSADFYKSSDIGGVIGSTTQADNFVHDAELFQSYYVNVSQSDFAKPFRITDFVHEVKQATFAVQANMNYNHVPGELLAFILHII